MNWNDHKDIVRALNIHYPNTSACGTSKEDLIEKVLALPGFEGKMPPPDNFHLIVFDWSLSKAVKSVETSTHHTRYENDSAYL
jgi:Fe-S-cluster formation regulator IscX/YfhJ